jgi:4-hydroxy-4-methyl-2-oxoglutarate aldolase
VADLVTAFSVLSTSTVSDALDKRRVAGQCEGLHPIDPAARICGRVFTVLYLPCETVKGDVGDYVDDVPEGYVAALDNRGRTDCTVWGDLLSRTASRRGLAGTVIDGVCRDSRASSEQGYSIFSRGVHMRTGKSRVYAAAYNVAITLGGVIVRPDDIVLGDRDGVVVIPAEMAEPVLESAREIAAAEERIRAEVDNGVPLAAARAKFAYHKLQDS